MKKAERIHLACIVDKSMSVTLPAPPYTECVLPSSHSFVGLTAGGNAAIMQSNTRSRLFEFLALGLVSLEEFVLREGAGMLIVVPSFCRTKVRGFHN